MCGVVGLTGGAPVAPRLRLALHTLQHRGQDAAGVAVCDTDGAVRGLRALGLVGVALPAERLGQLRGTVGIGHVRYPTSGGASASHAHPFTTAVRDVGEIAVAFNGNLVNAAALQDHVIASGLRPQTDSDGELLLLVIAGALARHAPTTIDTLVAALTDVAGRLRGGYTAVMTVPVDGTPCLVAVRDPAGLRPAVYGQRNNGAEYMVASESVALDALDFGEIAEVPPGALVVLRPGHAPVVRVLAAPAPRPCAFEHVYFARADSVVDGQRVNDTRAALGRALAQAWAARGLSADVVVGVPDTATPAAKAAAKHLGLPVQEGFIKNRYSGRTFILPDVPARAAALRLKLNPIREVFEGRRVLLIDDSLVRGATMRRTTHLVRSLRPTEIHVGVFSPAVRHPCFYGIDMPTSDELIASGVAPDALEARLCDHLSVDSVTFLPLHALRQQVSPACVACFDGGYPVPLTAAETRHIRQRRHAQRERGCAHSPKVGVESSQ